MEVIHIRASDFQKWRGLRSNAEWILNLYFFQFAFKEL